MQQLHHVPMRHQELLVRGAADADARSLAGEDDLQTLASLDIKVRLRLHAVPVFSRYACGHMRQSSYMSLHAARRLHARLKLSDWCLCGTSVDISSFLDAGPERDSCAPGAGCVVDAFLRSEELEECYCVCTLACTDQQCS